MNRFRLLVPCALAVVAVLLATAAGRQSKPPITADKPPSPVAAAPAAPASTPIEAPVPAPSIEPVTKAPTKATAKEAAPVAASETPAPAPVGMIVAVDPETGELVPASAEQIRALFPEGTEVTESMEGVVRVERADGTVGFIVGSRFQEYSYAHVGPDGKVHLGCGSAHGKLPAAGETPVASPKFEER